MKKKIYIPIIQGVSVTAGFLLVEIILNSFGVFDDSVRLYLVDVPLRILFGTIALILLGINLKKQDSEHGLKALFVNRIPKRTYILLLPFMLFLAVELLTIIVGEAKELSVEFAGMYSLNVAQQLATGYYEEGTRALLMCGFIKYCIDTKGKRIQTIVVSGIYFGLAHILNFLFGQDIVSTLWQVFTCFIWGLFISAIYIFSKNLTLIMVMHAVWDIIIGVPNAFCTLPESAVLIDVVTIMQDILNYGVMPMVAIYICMRYDKVHLRRSC